MTGKIRAAISAFDPNENGELYRSLQYCVCLVLVDYKILHFGIFSLLLTGAFDKHRHTNFNKLGSVFTR